MLNYSQNPYNVLSEIISFENVQKMGEMLTLKTLRTRSTYPRYNLEWLYLSFIRDLNHRNEPHHVFSDAYDLVQVAVCFLCSFVGKSLDDIYTVNKGEDITIKKAAYTLIGKQIDKICRYTKHTCNLDEASLISVEIDAYNEQDFSAVDNTISRLGLTTVEQETLDCFMADMGSIDIERLFGINHTTVWRRRLRIQAKYNALFP